MDIKTFCTGFKDINENDGIVAGYASTFNVKDDHNDIVMPGAFSRTINSWGPEGADRIKALYQHDPAWLVGKPIELSEDENGLFHNTKFSTDNAMSHDVFVLIRDEVITEQSIGYDVIKHGKGEDARLLKELKLWEYSFVTFGANRFTPITSVKSRTEEYHKLRERMNTMQKLINDNKLDSKEVKHMTNIALSKWQGEIKEIEDSKPFAMKQPKENDDMEEKAGRVLNAKNRALLEEAREDIDEVLRACDSDDDETQSTQEHGETDDSADSHSSEDEKAFDDVIGELKGIRGNLQANKTKSRLDKLSKELKGDE